MLSTVDADLEFLNIISRLLVEHLFCCVLFFFVKFFFFFYSCCVSESVKSGPWAQCVSLLANTAHTLEPFAWERNGALYTGIVISVSFKLHVIQ